MKKAVVTGVIGESGAHMIGPLHEKSYKVGGIKRRSSFTSMGRDE